MNARQRVLTLILIFFVLCGNCYNLLIARRRAISIVRAAEQSAGAAPAPQQTPAEDLPQDQPQNSAQSLPEAAPDYDVSQDSMLDQAAGEDSGFPFFAGRAGHPGTEFTVTKAFNADGTEHDFTQCKLVHVNWATAKELQQLPGIGAVLAKRIMEKRTERFFVEFKDLLQVPGIGEKRLAQIQPLICVAIPYVAE